MKKTNNKGFSLVELIIVIAIMAILIGVLAPQYIKYVERSRVSSDKDMIDSLTKAAQTATTDDDYYDGLNNNDSIQITNTGVVITPTATSLSAAVDEFYGSITNKFKSKAFKGQTIDIIVTDGGASASTLKVVVSDNGSPYNAGNYK